MVRKWNPERIVAAIRAWHEHDPTLRRVRREDQGLYYAAMRCLGSWNGAVRAAGLTPFQCKWTRQSVLDAIRARHEQGLPLRGITSRDLALYAAAQRHFGSWAEAMRAAGQPWKAKQTWSAEQVLAAIRRRHQQNISLRRVSITDRRLSYAAWKHFGRWANAVAAAGIADGWQRTWSRQRLIALLETYGTPDQPLSSRDVSVTVRRVAAEWFGSWHDALAAIGRTSPRPRPASPTRWTNEAILAAIRERARQGASLRMKTNKILASAAVRHFGSWSGALRAAGVQPSTRRIWTSNRVLKEIQAWDRLGAFAEGGRLEDHGLVRAARRRFGSWRGALVAAGVQLPDVKDQHRWKWPRRRILEAIQDGYVQGLPLIADRDRSLSKAAIRVFGSWRDALVAAGVGRDEEER
jgi:hypothetical protein